MQENIKNDQSSIINLFEKMHSNATKFKQSICYSSLASAASIGPTNGKSCFCIKQLKQRQLQAELYRDQYHLVSKVSSLVQAEGNETLAKLLLFMSEYLLKLSEEVSKQLLCQCKKAKIDQTEELLHKIMFLREENHKFFRMIEEKNEQCELMKRSLEVLSKQVEKQKQDYTSPLPITLKSQISVTSEMSQPISSRTISSNSSRVSEFRVVWPQLLMPTNQGAHKGYFDPSPGQAHLNPIQCLKDKDLNQSQNSSVLFKKSKIFCGACLIK